jgi:hypothetical protein
MTRKRGGALPQKVLNLFLKFNNFADLLRIDKFKPVATPASGSEPMMYKRAWLELSPEEQMIFIDLWKKKYGYTLGVHLANESDDRQRNLIVFYAKEYLEKLALAAEMTLDEILNIIEVFDTDRPAEINDIIKIAFNNEYDFLETETGRYIKQLYRRLVNNEL